MTSELLRPRWIVTTLLVVAAVALMLRLGLWQLDRLEQRRALNSRLEVALNAPPLDMNEDVPAVEDLPDYEYRTVVVSGRFDADQSVLLRNQIWEGRLGYHLFTPLLIDGTGRAVWVNRGWVPQEQGLDVPAPEGTVTLTGMLRREPARQSIGGPPADRPAEGENRINAWNRIDLAGMAEQTDLDLLPVYIQQAPVEGQGQPPYASLPEIEITEGSHLGYALQWFAFAAVLGIGYPFFVRRQLREASMRNTGVLAETAAPLKGE